jgi:hypothetical protein
VIQIQPLEVAMQESYSIIDNAISLKEAAVKLAGSIFPIAILFLFFVAIR